MKSKMNLRHKLDLLFIKDMLHHPYLFIYDGYTLTDTKTNRKWWIANGFIYFGLYYPFDVSSNGSYLRLFNKAAWKAWLLAKKRLKELILEEERKKWNKIMEFTEK